MIKPFFDLLASIFLLLLASPFLLLAIIALAIANQGKVWFVQERPGKDEKVFRVIKFKTMSDDKDAKGEWLPDAARLTRVGAFIRRTSLDELPQLINVIRGEMSLVGPRPLLMEYLPRYNAMQKKRHAVKPGITGWAQVNGRNAISWTDKFAFDGYYVDHISFWLDLKILIRTIYKVFTGEGISSPTSATMEKFQGNG